MAWRLFAALPLQEQIKLIAYAVGKVVPVNTVNKIRDFLKGKKTYVTAAIGLLGAVMAWAEGQISGTALLASAGAAVQACFIRAGISNEVQKSLPQ